MDLPVWTCGVVRLVSCSNSNARFDCTGEVAPLAVSTAEIEVFFKCEVFG